MRDTVVGVDVGLKGALAFYDGYELLIYDMPVKENGKNKRIDCQILNEIIFHQHSTIDHFMIENVNAFNMGRTSAFNFGWNCGVVEALAEAHGLKYKYVTPHVWKNALDCPTDKNEAMDRASQLMPSYKHNWPLKKHDGRAEAAMIALYGWNKKFNKGEV